MSINRITDLALEAHEINGERGEDDGIIVNERTESGINITCAKVKTGEGEKLSGKKAGTYITIDIGRIWQQSNDVFESTAHIISDELNKLLPEIITCGSGCTLVAGLGNIEISSDSIGPRTVSGIIVTRHIKELNSKLYSSVGFGCVAAMTPGVLGQTGIESAEIIKSVIKSTEPDCIIAIDALASRKLSRLATTVQLSDAGISPGSGVANHRNELSKDTLGIPVISIGIPTVVDAATLVYDLLGEIGGSDECVTEEVVENALNANGRNFFVTLKESDIITRETSRLISTSINLSLHKSIPIDEMNEYKA